MRDWWPKHCTWGAKQVLSRWSHPYVGYTAGGVLTVSASLVIGGFTGLGKLLALAADAQIQLFLSDDFQHYGLRREMLEGGRPEPIGPCHSWNAPHWYSSAMMLNAPRHSDHHIRPSRSFPSLGLDENTMSMLPQPLSVMACLALVPIIWRRVMDRCVAKWMVLEMIRFYKLILRILLTGFVLIGGGANAETMTASEFDAYTKGKTLFFGQTGKPYGAERYLENRRVQWSFLDGICKDGYWYEEAGEICFIYEGKNTPQCWTFEEGPSGLIARFSGDPQKVDLYEVQNSDQEMICLGPQVEV